MGSVRQLKAFCKVGKVCFKEMNASEPLRKHRFDASSFWMYLVVYGVIICFVCIMIDFFRKLLFSFIRVEKIIEYMSLKWNMLLEKAMIRIS